MMSIRRWSGFFVVMVAVLALACGKKDKDSGKQEPPKTTKPGKDGNKPKPSVKLGPSPFPQLKMVVDGKPVPVHSIYAYWVGEEAVKIEVSSAKRSCNMHPQMRNNLPGEKFVKIWFSKQLDKQGKASWAVVQSYFAGGTNQDKKRKSVSITASPATVGGHVEGTLSIAQEGFARRNRPAQKLNISGPFKATVCKVPKAKGFTERDGDLAIDVAGVKSRLLGAIVKTVGDHTRVIVSTDPRSCHRSAGLGRVVLKLILKKGELKRILLSGSWFPNRMTENTIDKDALKITIGPPTDKGTPLELNGTAKVLGYPIKLSGKTTALSCK